MRTIARGNESTFNVVHESDALTLDIGGDRIKLKRAGQLVASADYLELTSDSRKVTAWEGNGFRLRLGDTLYVLDAETSRQRDLIVLALRTLISVRKQLAMSAPIPQR